MTNEQTHAAAVLDGAVATMVAAGGRLETRSERQAIVMFGKPMNHTVHMVLAVITLGVWLPFWFIATATHKYTRAILTLDDDNEIVQRNVVIKAAH